MNAWLARNCLIVLAIGFLAARCPLNAADSSLRTRAMSTLKAGQEQVVKYGKQFMDTIFNTELPFTSDDSALQLHIIPKFKDVASEPYIRLPIEFRYGFTENVEGSFGVIPFLGNPFDSDREGSAGYLTLGFKHRLNNFINDNWQFAYGAKAVQPMDRIPNLDPRRDYGLYQPYFVVSYQFPNDKRWSWYANVSYDLVGSNIFDGNPAGPRPYSLFTLRPGIMYKSDEQFRYSLEFEYKTDEFDGGGDDAYRIIPGITWYPPEDRRFFKLPGEFDFGLRVAYAFDKLPEDAHRSDVRVSLRIRWRIEQKKQKDTTALVERR